MVTILACFYSGFCWVNNVLKDSFKKKKTSHLYEKINSKVSKLWDSRRYYKWKIIHIFFLSDTYNTRKSTKWKDVIIQIIHRGHKIYQLQRSEQTKHVSLRNLNLPNNVLNSFLQVNMYFAILTFRQHGSADRRTKNPLWKGWNFAIKAIA